MKIKNIIFIVSALGFTFQSQAAMQLKSVSQEDDLIYGNLTLEDLQTIQSNVAYEIQQREKAALKEYFLLISEGQEFDKDGATKVACRAWSSARSPEQQGEALNFMALLVKNELAYGLAVQAARFGVMSLSSDVQEAAYDLCFCLVEQGQCMEFAKRDHPKTL